jgi:hypothetical protein
MRADEASIAAMIGSSVFIGPRGVRRGSGTRVPARRDEDHVNAVIANGKFRAPG